MNRRNFIGKLLAIGASFTVLPPAATARIWKAVKPAPKLELIMPIQDMPFSTFGFAGKWQFIVEDLGGVELPPPRPRLFQSDFIYAVRPESPQLIKEFGLI